MNEVTEQQDIAARMAGSLLVYTRVMFEARTKRPFLIYDPPDRESHLITICRALTRVFRGEVTRLIINIPPRYGKTECIIHFIAWCLAQYPTCNFIYTSYAHSLAEKQTETVRQILLHPDHKALFGVPLSEVTNTKSDFETAAGGSVLGVGAGGPIMGRGAGLRNNEHFGGAIIIDDIIKAEEALSDTVRENRNQWFANTLMSRRNHTNTPIIIIAQRLHELDLPGALMEGLDGHHWDTVIIPALSTQGNPLNPDINTKEDLEVMRDKSPFEFNSQYQQRPQPAGGSLYQKEWVQELTEEPELLCTFMMVDCAESVNVKRNATVFTHMGLHWLKYGGHRTNTLGLHVINCAQIWVEPKDLEQEFLDFWGTAANHKVPPRKVGIEKKSAGTTLGSILKDKVQGLTVIQIDRNSTSGNKSTRFANAQPLFSSKIVSVMGGTTYGAMVIEHLGKITANDTHALDDIADTIVDGLEFGVVKKLISFDLGVVQSNLELQFKLYQPRLFQ